MKIVPVTVRPVSILVECHLWTATVTRKISESSIAEFNITTQLNTTSEPMTRMELVISLVSVTEDGLGIV